MEMCGWTRDSWTCCMSAGELLVLCNVAEHALTLARVLQASTETNRLADAHLTPKRIQIKKKQKNKLVSHCLADL